MTASVRQLLESFDALPEPDKHQATIEILRRLSGAQTGDLPDGALTGLADELFRTLDEQEASHAAS